MLSATLSYCNAERHTYLLLCCVSHFLIAMLCVTLSSCYAECHYAEYPFTCMTSILDHAGHADQGQQTLAYSVRTIIDEERKSFIKFVPDLPAVLSDGSVGAELAGGGHVHDGHLGPQVLILLKKTALRINLLWRLYKYTSLLNFHLSLSTR